MAEPATITLRCDTRQIQDDCALLSEFAKRSLKLQQRLLDLGDFRAHVRCVDADPAFAPGAGQFGIRLEFSNGLAELVAAVRAGDFDGL
jgi:hypothetical protein